MSNPTTYVLLVKNAYGWSRNIGADGGDDGNQWDTKEKALAAAAELDKCWGNPDDDENGNPVTREWRVVESSEADRMALID